MTHSINGIVLSVILRVIGQLEIISCVPVWNKKISFKNLTRATHYNLFVSDIKFLIIILFVCEMNYVIRFLMEILRLRVMHLYSCRKIIYIPKYFWLLLIEYSRKNIKFYDLLIYFWLWLSFYNFFNQIYLIQFCLNNLIFNVWKIYLLPLNLRDN